jgi:hypothetical protein
MIRYALICDKGHGFESWFASSTAYDRQAKRKLVACPHCGSVKVDKALMAPRLATSRKAKRVDVAENHAAASTEPAKSSPPAPAAEPVAMISPREQEVRAKLKELRDHLVKNADNVGGKFPEEARKMHYGETKHRSIYGIASPDEASELADEGIDFHALPVLPDERN